MDTGIAEASQNKIVKKIKELPNGDREYSPYDMWRLHQFKEEYIKGTEIDNLTLRESIYGQDLLHWKYSAINRYSMMMLMAYTLVIDTVNTIVVTYKIKDIKLMDKEVIYAMAYIAAKPKEKEMLYVSLLEQMHKGSVEPTENIYIQQVCISGSMISKDGEYRSSIINWNLMRIIFSTNPKLKKIFDYILAYFNDVLRERKYLLLIEHYFPNDNLRNLHNYETELVANAQKIAFFALAWFNFYYSYYFGFISNHLNDTYRNLMLKYKKQDIAFFKSIWDKFAIDDIEEFRYVCSNDLRGVGSSIQTHSKLKIGQKIIPLNLLEAQNFFNLEYQPWKEFLINCKASDLVVNNVSNGFALTNNWFLIKNTGKRLYDNPSQVDRLEKSKIALKIADILAQAKLYTHMNVNAGDVEPLVDSEELDNYGKGSAITSWLSNEFKRLHIQIQDAIDSTKEHIIMSNVSLGIVTEFLGKTLYDVMFLTKKSSYYNNLVDHLFSAKNYTFMRKYMFQLCYNIYCLNTKLHIIHGDLHLNNITLNSILYKKSMQIDIKNPKIMYVLDNKQQYIFDNNFYDLCIIDYSRAIISPDHYESLRNESIPDSYNIIHSRNKFMEKQIKALMTYLVSTKPEFKEFGAMLETEIIHHYNEYFKILSVLDIYNISSKLIEFFKSKEASAVSTCKESIKLISDINKNAEHYLSIVLNKLITSRNFDEVAAMEWPMLGIIQNVFEPNLAIHYTQAEYAQVIDVYNYSNELKHSLSTYKNFPPTVKEKKKWISGKVVEATKAEKKIRTFSIRRRKLYEDKTFHNYQVVNIIQKRQLEKNI
jgi:hypothetical protein